MYNFLQKKHNAHTSPCCFDRFPWICLDLFAYARARANTRFSVRLRFFSRRFSSRLFYGRWRRRRRCMIIKWIRELPGHGRQEKRITLRRRLQRRRVHTVFFSFSVHTFLCLFFRRSFVSGDDYDRDGRPNLCVCVCVVGFFGGARRGHSVSSRRTNSYTPHSLISGFRIIFHHSEIIASAFGISIHDVD